MNWYQGLKLKSLTVAEITFIVAYIFVLLIAIVLLVNMYVCDSQKCKIFGVAQKKDPSKTGLYSQTLLEELVHDGVWPFSYIASSIIVPLVLWLLYLPISVYNFGLMFLTCFIVIYCLFSFYGHHYVRFVSLSLQEYLDSQCK